MQEMGIKASGLSRGQLPQRILISVTNFKISWTSNLIRTVQVPSGAAISLISGQQITSIMDLFSRKIIAWTLSDTLEVSCVIDTIYKAKARRNTELPLIIHSDRGSHYVSTAYKEATVKMERSYSKKAFLWDNACIESFHALIKREWLNRFRIRDYGQAYRLVFEYLEVLYNTKRIHSHCDYISPNDFEKLYEQESRRTVAHCKLR